jgi:hypothetical protein
MFQNKWIIIIVIVVVIIIIIIMSLSRIPASSLNLLSLPGVTASFICSALRTSSFDELPSGPMSSYSALGVGSLISLVVI